MRQKRLPIYYQSWLLNEISDVDIRDHISCIAVRHLDMFKRYILYLCQCDTNRFYPFPGNDRDSLGIFFNRIHYM